MKINPNLSGFHYSTPLRRLFTSLGLVIVGGTIIFSLFMLIGNLIFSEDLAILANQSPVTGPEDPGFIRFVIIAQDISFFIIPSLIILVVLDPLYKTGTLNIKRVGLNDVLLVIILSFCAFPVTGIAGQLNSSMTMPHWLSGIEQWMREKEDYADHLLDVLMGPETLSVMWLNILIIAALPAIGEELIFRGVFQRILQDLFRSGHLAVWIMSILFSAIHFQFYGFLPRLILGLIFGYLFLWGRNIWLPVIAHFINNAVPAVVAYLKGWEDINQHVASGQERQIIGTILPLVIGIIILAWFRKRYSDYAKVYSDPSQADQV